MTKRTRRQFTPEYKERSVARLSEAGVTYASLAAELGLTSGQLKTWHLELLAAELAQLRRDNKRLKEENEVMRKASVLFAQWAAKTVRPSGRHRFEAKAEREARLHRRQRHQSCDLADVPGASREPQLVPYLAPDSPGAGATYSLT